MLLLIVGVVVVYPILLIAYTSFEVGALGQATFLDLTIGERHSKSEDEVGLNKYNFVSHIHDNSLRL